MTITDALVAAASPTRKSEVMNPGVMTAYYEPAAGKRDALVEVLAEIIPRVHAERGCQFYAVHDAPDGSIVLIAKWATLADFEAHATGEVVAEQNRALEGLLAEPVRVVRLEPLPLGDARGSL
jgi:quinol monooxygenase YgiN